MTAVTSAQSSAPASFYGVSAACRNPEPPSHPHSQRATVAWLRVVPGPEEYGEALDAQATWHAAHWGLAAATWPPLEAVYDTDRPAAVARAALLKIANAPWGERFLAKGDTDALLRLLDDPSDLLEPLKFLPLTLIADSDLGLAEASHGDSAFVAGPAAYDLARVYSSARWWFGRAPLSLTETRNRYLRTLNALLDQPLDRRLFDAALDAAVAWRFALLWPPAIIEHHACLLACLNHARATVVEPALASLRRTLR